MNNIVAKNQREVKNYRKTIFKSKEECRKMFAKESFEKKIETAFEIYRFGEYLKNLNQRQNKNGQCDIELNKLIFLDIIKMTRKLT